MLLLRRTCGDDTHPGSGTSAGISINPLGYRHMICGWFSCAKESRELEAFVEQFRGLFPRQVGVQNCMLYPLGPASDLLRKYFDRMVEVLPAASVGRLEEFLAETLWEAEALNAQCVRLMVAHG